MPQEAKHTPGPWRVKGKYVWQDGGPVTLEGAICILTDPTHPSAIADAHLIAAAPEQHDALAWIVTYAEEHADMFFPDGNPDGDHAEGQWYEVARAAIAKAGPRKEN